jgi:tRNA pseudouridine65 synthase
MAVRGRHPWVFSAPGPWELVMQTVCDLDALQILFEDDDLVAVHKPAGLLVHRSPIDRQETQFALQLTRDLVGAKVFPVHRLDKATSGLLLFAKSAAAASRLQPQFARHEVRKFYKALVRGWTAAECVMDQALVYRCDAHGDRGRRQSSTPQTACTYLTRLATASLDKPLQRYPQQRYSLVELAPLTGRKHQLRRHLNRQSHPIIGDVNYGDRHHNHLFAQWLGYHRLYLAACQLQFRHPATGELITLDAPLQDDFAHTLQCLNLPLS